MTNGRRNVQSACPVCGASLPHTTPMAREYHESVARRSVQDEADMSFEQQSELTAQDLHAAFSQAYREIYADMPGSGKLLSWDRLNDNERAAYTRMAELLNQKKMTR